MNLAFNTLMDAVFSLVGGFLQDLLQEVKQLKSKVDELEGEKSQYERKLRATKVLHTSTCQGLVTFLQHL